MNIVNATFAATYDIIRRSSTDVFPIRGEFDPEGVSIGWVVSYWNKYMNDHAIGAWAGYLEREGDREKPSIVTTRLISHNGDPTDVTVLFDRFTLEE